MKKLLLTILFGAFGLMSEAQQRYVGGDISLLPTYEANGAWWNDENNQHITDMLQYLKAQGLNSLRVRLFVNPANAHKAHQMQGVRQDLEYVKALGKRIKDAGFSLMLDFHYSDTWADPGKQFTPKEWENLSNDQLYQKIYDYTKDCLQQMVAVGATPDFIQTGNEISYGMLWGKGVITKDTYNASTGKGDLVYSNNDASYVQCFYDDRHESNWQRFYQLLKHAGNACREVCPQAKIILHTERVPRPANVANFMKRMQDNDVDYDILGLSYYPSMHGSLTQLGLALNQTNAYNKPVMIVETSYHYVWYPQDAEYNLTSTWPATPAGQAAFTRDLIAKLKEYQQVIGLYWWPIECSENGISDWDNKRVTDGWCNSSLFNDTNTSETHWGYGQVMPAMQELKTFVEGASGVSNVRMTRCDGRWYSLQGMCYDAQPQRRGLYIVDGRKVFVK